jgi:hypothetical protein
MAPSGSGGFAVSQFIIKAPSGSVRVVVSRSNLNVALWFGSALSQSRSASTAPSVYVGFVVSRSVSTAPSGFVRTCRISFQPERHPRVRFSQIANSFRLNCASFVSSSVSTAPLGNVRAGRLSSQPQRRPRFGSAFRIESHSASTAPSGSDDFVVYLVKFFSSQRHLIGFLTSVRENTRPE